ncbi:MAG: hypothetical protein U1F52_02345 [Burkholderiales bacterium]
MNVRMPEAVAARVDQPVIDAVSTGATDDRARLLADMLSALAARLEAFAASGFAPLEPSFRARHALQGKAVSIAMPDRRTVTGRVEGTGPDGALRVFTAAGLQSFHGGEVSVRREPEGSVHG